MSLSLVLDVSDSVCEDGDDLFLLRFVREDAGKVWHDPVESEVSHRARFPRDSHWRVRVSDGAQFDFGEDLGPLPVSERVLMSARTSAMRRIRSIRRMSARMIGVMTKGIKAGELSLRGNRRGDLHSRGKSQELPALCISRRSVRCDGEAVASDPLGRCGFWIPPAAAPRELGTREMEKGIRNKQGHRYHFHSILSARMMIDGRISGQIS
jgi:hypothetical protein